MAVLIELQTVAWDGVIDHGADSPFGQAGLNMITLTILDADRELMKHVSIHDGRCDDTPDGRKPFVVSSSSHPSTSVPGW